MGHQGRQSADETLAAALAAGRAVREAGVSERTVHRRLADQAFADRVREVRTQLMSAAAGRLSDGMADAVRVIRDLLSDPRPGVRLRAPTRMTEFGVRLDQQIDQARELESLHRQMDGIERERAALKSEYPEVRAR